MSSCALSGQSRLYRPNRDQTSGTPCEIYPLRQVDPGAFLSPRHRGPAWAEEEVTVPSEANPPRDPPLGLPLLAGDPLKALLSGPLRASFGLTLGGTDPLRQDGGGYGC